MHNFDLLMTLAAGFLGSTVFGYITHRLGWSPIVGYLLAGALVGPHTPGFVADKTLADQLAEVGVILLMFGVGLHFHLKDLMAVKKVAIGGAVCQSAAATVLGAVVVHLFGWGWPAGIVYGLALSVASTVVLLRALEPTENLSGRTQGPALLCQAMGIDRRHNGVDLLGGELYVEREAAAAPLRIVKRPRIGVDYAGAWAKRLLRFYIRDNPFVSRR